MFNIGFIRIPDCHSKLGGQVYLNRESVVDYIREQAGCEETDVRNRWEQIALNLKEVGDD